MNATLLMVAEIVLEAGILAFDFFRWGGGGRGKERWEVCSLCK